MSDLRRFLLVLACGMAVTLLRVEAGQDAAPPQATFRSGVEIVDVDVSVLDSDRLPVRGLTAADFTVLEDGRPRPVVAFSEVELPPRELASAPWMTAVAPDVIPNTFAREGRLVVMLFDRSIEYESSPAARAFAEAAIEQLRPGDLGAVVYSSLGVPQNFTADRARLRAAVAQPLLGIPDDDDGSAADCFCGVCALESVANVAEALGTVRQRRKMLFYIGSSIPIQSNGPCSGLVDQARNRAMRAVEVANVTVHSFDPSGLPTLATGASSRTALDRGSALRALNRRGNLRVFPDETGGRAVFDDLRPGDRVAELFRESNAYYVLGFQPGADTRPGKYHRIQVKVNRRDVTIQARQGYYTGGGPSVRPDLPKSVARAGIQPAMWRAIEGLWPKTDVALSLSALPFATPTLERATVAVVVGARIDLDAVDVARMPEAASTAPTAVNVLVGAFDRFGRAVATVTERATVTPRQSGPRTLEYEATARLELGPGRYELRAAIDDTRLGRAGSVYAYVDVPAYRREALAMSGLVIEGGASAAAGPAPLLVGLAPVTPTTRRTFARTEPVTGFVRIYQGLTRAVTPGYVQVTIRDEQDQAIFSQESRLVSEQFGATRAVDFSVNVPMARLAPGEYLMSIEARSGTATSRRDARFRVTP